MNKSGDSSWLSLNRFFVLMIRREWIGYDYCWIPIDEICTSRLNSLSSNQSIVLHIHLFSISENCYSFSVVFLWECIRYSHINAPVDHFDLLYYSVCWICPWSFFLDYHYVCFSLIHNKLHKEHVNYRYFWACLSLLYIVIFIKTLLSVKIWWQ